jgi:hypothetical protein
LGPFPTGEGQSGGKQTGASLGPAPEKSQRDRVPRSAQAKTTIVMMMVVMSGVGEREGVHWPQL